MGVFRILNGFVVNVERGVYVFSQLVNFIYDKKYHCYCQSVSVLNVLAITTLKYFCINLINMETKEIFFNFESLVNGLRPLSD